MTFVYVLSDHDEGGAEHATATLRRDALLDMIDTNWNWVKNPGWILDAKTRLAGIMQQSDDELAAAEGGKHCVHDGWGGIQLHVLRLIP